ncbi:MAG TPA: hypothetical protein VG895_03495 [Patescibacteria group bacterium]|nr:hypothetical protein [Patescibacteria group bacterium]
MLLNFQDRRFTIDGKIRYGKLNLIMEVYYKKYINTKSIPATVPVLSSDLPSIFKCECFNEENKNFKEESGQTELGHLFEHIMLEYLCITKLNSGCKQAIYEGVTNWAVDNPYIFNIQIKTGKRDIENIEKAFKKSTRLLGKILG